MSYLSTVHDYKSLSRDCVVDGENPLMTRTAMVTAIVADHDAAVGDRARRVCPAVQTY